MPFLLNLAKSKTRDYNDRLLVYDKYRWYFKPMLDVRSAWFEEHKEYNKTPGNYVFNKEFNETIGGVYSGVTSQIDYLKAFIAVQIDGFAKHELHTIRETRWFEVTG